MSQDKSKLLAEKNKNLVSCSIVYRNGKYIVIDETDFWRRGVMKKLPVLGSLSIVALTGIILALILK